LRLVAGAGVECDTTDKDFGEPRPANVDANQPAGVDTTRGLFPVTDTIIGENELMNWGYWTQADFMTSASGLNYRFFPYRYLSWCTEASVGPAGLSHKPINFCKGSS